MGENTLRATNNFKAFATAVGANVTSQTDYKSLSALASGFQPGKVSSEQINKALRQANSVSLSLAQFISNTFSSDVLDNGAFLTELILIQKKRLSGRIDQISELLGFRLTNRSGRLITKIS